MATNRSIEAQPANAAEVQLARLASDGSARHPHLLALSQSSGPHSGRDLADAVHLLCALHGRYPGLVGIALERCAVSPAQRWLSDAAEAFERERLFLVRLTAAVGPTPSTPGAAQTEAGLLAARHALETLAMSERCGCALGAATAMIGDWRPVREVLDRAAARAGIEIPPSSLPGDDEIAAVIEAEARNPAAARALAFGGEQLLLQHRALFDLLEARAAARGDY